jgi:hypothetical protein
MKKLTTEEFIEKSKVIHVGKYDYSKVNYTIAKSKVIIRCLIHGEFLQTPEKHLLGRGCNICGMKKRNEKLRKSQEQFLTDVKNIYGNLYNYSKTKYISNHIKSEVICHHHGPFWVTPDNHLVLKRGCPKCVHRVSKSEMEFLDYLKIPNTNLHRQVYISNKQVDGFDPIMKIIYEYLGDYWHGNPEKYNQNEINVKCHKTFGELYVDTINKFKKLKSLGHGIKYIWENDWKRFKSGIDFIPKILEF